MNKRCIFLLLFCSGICLTNGYAQHRNVFSLFLRPFKEAEKLYEQGDYMTAITWYEKALSKEKRRKDLIKLRIADSYRLLHHTKEAEQWYKDIMNTKSLIGPQDVVNYAQVLLSNKKYEASKTWFQHYNKEYGVDSLVLNKIKGIDRMSYYFEDSLSSPVQPLSINSPYSEFAPVFYGKGLIFTSSRQSESMVKLNNNKDSNAFLNLYYTESKENNEWSDPKPWQHSSNSSFHEGPIIFYDNEHKAIVTQNFSLHHNPSKRDTRHLGLFSIEQTDSKKWKDPISLPFNNINYSVAHAATNTTGDILYYSSNMPGGYGGTDLYVTHRKDSQWTTPMNLGPAINTSGNELFPYLFRDSILYFSSTGHAGLGGLDIYYTSRCGEGFCELENPGYPINSSQDDFGIVFAEDHKSGYLSSNRNKGGSDDDLFSFEVIKIFLKGNIRAKLKNSPLSDVAVILSIKGKEVLSTTTNDQGDFLMTLDPSEEYTLSVVKENYKIITRTLSTRHRQASDTLVQDLLLEKEVKTLVKGVVQQDHRPIPNLKIIARESLSNHQDTILSDDRGEFYVEADPSLEYVFHVDTRYAYGELLLEPSKKTKGTFLLYAKIELHPYDTTFVNVLVKEEKGPIANALVVLENTVTKKQDSLYTNKKGIVRFIAKSYANYNINGFYKGKTGHLANFNMLNNRMRTLVIPLRKEMKQEE